jgi:uncharacterized protein YeaO (DUF488 family)
MNEASRLDSNVRIKRIYEPKEAEDGLRILVDRLWPRGLTKARAALDLWLKDAAPSTDLRIWFGHRPDRWEAFRERYLYELRTSPAMAQLRALARENRVTLLYAASDQDHNEAVVLAACLHAPIAGPADQEPVSPSHR